MLSINHYSYRHYEHPKNNKGYKFTQNILVAEDNKILNNVFNEESFNKAQYKCYFLEYKIKGFIFYKIIINEKIYVFFSKFFMLNIIEDIDSNLLKFFNFTNLLNILKERWESGFLTDEEEDYKGFDGHYPKTICKDCLRKDAYQYLNQETYSNFYLNFIFPTEVENFYEDPYEISIKNETDFKKFKEIEINKFTLVKNASYLHLKHNIEKNIINNIEDNIGNNFQKTIIKLLETDPSLIELIKENVKKVFYEIICNSYEFQVELKSDLNNYIEKNKVIIKEIMLDYIDNKFDTFIKNTIKKENKIGSDGRLKTYLALNPKTNLVKIGKSKNPEKRIKHHECACGCKLQILLIINHDCESDLHKKFQHYRDDPRHEWFKNSDEIKEFIKQNIA